MNIIRIKFTKNNIYYNIKNNLNQDLTRSLGVYGIYNSYKRFPNAFEEITTKIMPDLTKFIQQLIPIQIIFYGYKSKTRLYLLSQLIKQKYQIYSILDKTSYKYNGCKFAKMRR